MKKNYQQPAMQEETIETTIQLLVGTNIGPGGEGQGGDVKSSNIWSESEEGSIFDENPFK